MVPRAALFLGVALFAAVGAPANAMTSMPSPKPLPTPYKAAGQLLFFIKLDNRWYDLLEAEPFAPFVTFDRTGLRAFTAHMANCRRSDGQPPQFTPFAFYYGRFLTPIWSIRDPMRYKPGSGLGTVYYFEINTIPGNYICDHEVPNPFDLPDRIFRDGFDGDDARIFRGTFEFPS